MKTRIIQLALIALIDVYAALAMAAPLTLQECIMQALRQSPPCRRLAMKPKRPAQA